MESETLIGIVLIILGIIVAVVSFQYIIETAIVEFTGFMGSVGIVMIIFGAVILKSK